MPEPRNHSVYPESPCIIYLTELTAQELFLGKYYPFIIEPVYQDEYYSASDRSEEKDRTKATEKIP